MTTQPCCRRCRSQTIVGWECAACGEDQRPPLAPLPLIAGKQSRREPALGAVPLTDRRPEHTNYQDTGCRFHSACLSCPFSVCIEERWSGGQKAIVLQYQVNALVADGWDVGAIAERFGISKRQAYRYGAYRIGRGPGAKGET
jgi:hypothetical protein